MGLHVNNAFALKGGLNGLKMIFGAVLIVLAHQMELVKELIPMFPDAGFLVTILQYLAIAFDYLSDPVAIIGNLGLVGGLLHKIWKLFKR